jgi:hypothetical protein
MLNRRTLLAGVAIAPLSACTVAQVANFDQQWATAQVWIAQQVQLVAKVLPTAESVAAVAAGLFGPQYQAIVVAGSAIANQVVAAILAVINAAAPPPPVAGPATPPPASGRLGLPRFGSGPPAIIGNTGPLPWSLAGANVAGWHTP